MKKVTWKNGLTMSSLAFVLALGACGNGTEEDTNSEDTSSEETESTSDTESTDETESTEENNSSDDEASSDENASGQLFSYEDFPKKVSNDAEPTGSGTLKVGYASDTPFEGTLNWAFYSGNPDATMIGYFDEAVFTYDENFQLTNEGAIHYEVNEDDNTITYTVQDGVKWHDGEPLKASDYVASYKVIGHPEYNGVRGSEPGFTLIEGYDEYKAGEADDISGIEIVDDKTAVFTYKELAPSLLAGGVWAYAFPEHHFEGVEVAEMAESPQTRENPIGIGPYKVSSIQPGEAVVVERFDDYWRGTPQLDGIEIQVISTSSIAQAVESEQVDIGSSFPTDQYPDVADMENVEWLANIDGAYTYIGFKLGEWNEEESKVDYKPEEMKMGDKELRRAMWHAIDNDAVGERFYNGLRWKANSFITPYHNDWYNEDIEVPEYDPEEANRILDEAGYEDTDGDGFRETPDGEPLEINFASMSGGDIAEPIANYYIQAWRNIGLNVVLTNGRLIEFNTFYDMVKNDDPAIDIYQGAWGVGYNVDPNGFWGPSAVFNYTRFENDEITELMNEGNSPEAFDVEKRIEIYNEWQQKMVEEIPAIPTLYRSFVVPVNERVVNYSVENGFNEETALYNIGVSEE